jgi:hypothetical protein
MHPSPGIGLSACRLTAGRYLLHEQSNNFLKPVDSHLDAALTCTTYLSFTSLDGLLSTTWETADIETQILQGDFVFLEYAALEYMEHIKAWMSRKPMRTPWK